MSDLSQLFVAQTGGFRPDPRFGGIFAAEAPPSMPEPDLAEEAFADGYAKGLEEGFAQAMARAEEDAAARGHIELALGRLSETEELRFEERLRETVLILCEKTLQPLATDPEALSERVSCALMLLRRTEDERILRLHPADIALLKGRLPETVKIEPDPSLERGELRIETSEGGVEDGPGQWRRALCEALGL